MRNRIYIRNWDKNTDDAIKMLHIDRDREGYFYYHIKSDRRSIGWVPTRELEEDYKWIDPKMPRFTKEQLERVK